MALGKSLEWGYTLFKFTFPMEKQRRQVKQVFDKFGAWVTERIHHMHSLAELTGNFYLFDRDRHRQNKRKLSTRVKRIAALQPPKTPTPNCGKKTTSAPPRQK